MDIDHNYYNVVKIGNQTWMAENLNVGKFIFASYTGVGQTDNNIIEKYCYDNTISNCSVYGGLYDWDEMMQYEPQDSGKTGTTKGVCPAGWHIPTQAEIFILEDNAGGNLVGGGNLKETGLTHWNDPNVGATNLTGFTAIGGGIWFNGNFESLGWESIFHSSTFISPYGIFGFQLGNEGSGIGTYFNSPNSHPGFSVRCVKDPPEK
jgi:uncharacterized protein (TIGR02145 family)